MASSTPSPNMTNAHRLFLQSFMSKGILNVKEVREIYVRSCNKYDVAYDTEKPEKTLVAFVHTINANLKDLLMEIKKAIDEVTGKNYYVLVQTASDECAKFVFDFNPNELDLFKKLVEAIVMSPNGTVSSTDALNLTEDQAKPMSKQNASDFFVRLEDSKWLCKTAGGRYSLSPRSIAELETYICEQYAEFSLQCNMCRKVCLQGQYCSACDTRLHFYCAARFFHNQQNELRCPNANCGAVWPYGRQPSQT